tara:strand:- start:4105 stop:4518 length:414 start_codon:yes stop_codon:yes gene_type:complete
MTKEQLYKDRVSKITPVMETTIEGAQKRIKPIIEWYDGYADGNPWGTDLEYIGVFLDTVGDEMAAMSTAYNSLHDRYVEALASIDQLQDDWNTVDAEAANHLIDKIQLRGQVHELLEENIKLAKACLKLTHAANDNT